MPGYVHKIFQRFQHAVPARKQDSPYHAPPLKYGTAAQDPLPEDTSDKINEKRVKIIQQVIGGVLYYARAIDLTVLAALRFIASEQASATEDTETRVSQLLDYLATHPDAKVRYHASDMVLNIQPKAGRQANISSDQSHKKTGLLP